MSQELAVSNVPSLPYTPPDSQLLVVSEQVFGKVGWQLELLHGHALLVLFLRLSSRARRLPRLGFRHTLSELGDA